MNRDQSRKLARAGILLTVIWLAVGTPCFVYWQMSERVAATTGHMWRQAIGAALLVALIFWVLAGIAHGIVVWIVTGRGPRA